MLWYLTVFDCLFLCFEIWSKCDFDQPLKDYTCFGFNFVHGFCRYLYLIEMGWKAAEKLIRHWKVLRGDNVRAMKILTSLRIYLSISITELFQSHLQVMIIRGKDKGETGIIKRVIRSQNRVIVEGKNLVSVNPYYWNNVPIWFCLTFFVQFSILFHSLV